MLPGDTNVGTGMATASTHNQLDRVSGPRVWSGSRAPVAGRGETLARQVNVTDALSATGLPSTTRRANPTRVPPRKDFRLPRSPPRTRKTASDLHRSLLRQVDL